MKILADIRHCVSSIQVLWREWNLRSFIIASFTLQLYLILVAPFRKQTSNGVVVISIWISYLLADWVAVQAVGLISKTSDNDAQGDLYAFWAQFLLVHIGGPDTITALALEDNELWLRTALQLGVQVYATLGVLVKSFNQSKVWGPTLLMFYAGLIKYLERVLSLLHGRLTNLEKESEANEELLKAYEPSCDPHLPFPDDPITERSKGQLTDVEMVGHAFYFFHFYKGLYADRAFRFLQWRKSRNYFFRRTSEEAFAVLELEFNFAYEVFYTKMVIVHKRIGKVLRPIAMLFEVACFVIWCFTEKHEFRAHDIRITYALLIGGIAVDVLALLRVQLSYRNIAQIKKESKIRNGFYNFVLSAWSRTWGTYWRSEEASFRPWLRRALFRRWSESISQFNLINLCADKRSKKMQKAIEFIHLSDVLDRQRFVTKKWFSDAVRDIVFERLWRKSEMIFASAPHGSKNNVPPREDWAAKYERYLRLSGLGDLVKTEDMEFDESLLVWHIATEICYQLEADESKEDNKEESFFNGAYGFFRRKFAFFCRGIEENKDIEKGNPPAVETVPKINVYREFCKIVSDYVLYLLIQQPNMMSSFVGRISKTRFEDTCSHVMKTLEDPDLRGLMSKVKKKSARQKGVCHHIFETQSGWKVEGSSVLCQAARLAMQLRVKLPWEFEERDKWRAVAGLWVEALCHAAAQCKASVHAAQLKQGGELLSLVWLLTVHFGIGLPLEQ